MSDLYRTKTEFPCPNKKCYKKITVTYGDLKTDKQITCSNYSCKSGYELDRSEQYGFKSAVNKLEQEVKDMAHLNKDIEKAQKELEKAHDNFGKELNDLIKKMKPFGHIL